MRRIMLSITIAAIMVATIALTPGSAFADSCFDDLALASDGIGPVVGGIATTLATPGTGGGPGTPGSTVPVADPGLLNQFKQIACQQPPHP